MQKLTFEQLPEAISILIEKVDRIEKFLTSNDEQDQFELLDVEKAADFLKLSKPTIYSKVCRGELSGYKAGRRLYFKKDELKKWLVKDPILTYREIGHIADKYIEKRAARRRF
jgi:excisionase family DNA binding protein